MYVPLRIGSSLKFSSRVERALIALSHLDLAVSVEATTDFSFSTSSDGAAWLENQRFRFDRAQRSLCQSGDSLPAPARRQGRCRFRQPAWRRDRARPPARHERRAAGDDGGARHGEAGAASLPWQPCASASARALRLRSKRLIETAIWESEKQSFPKLVMSYNDLAARLSGKIAKQFCAASTMRGRSSS